MPKVCGVQIFFESEYSGLSFCFLHHLQHTQYEEEAGKHSSYLTEKNHMSDTSFL